MHRPRRLCSDFYTGWYRELVTYVPQPVRGLLGKPPGLGIGCELLPGVCKRKDPSAIATSL